MFINKNHTNIVTLLRSMSFNVKEWINIDHKFRFNKTVVDFILGLHDVLKVLRVYC